MINEASYRAFLQRHRAMRRALVIIILPIAVVVGAWVGIKAEVADVWYMWKKP